MAQSVRVSIPKFSSLYPETNNIKTTDAKVVVSCRRCFAEVCTQETPNMGSIGYTAPVGDIKVSIGEASRLYGLNALSPMAYSEL